jgi:uncharacterized protein
MFYVFGINEKIGQANKAQEINMDDNKLNPPLKPTTLNLKVIPNASKTEIIGWLGERLKIKVASPPEKGKANTAVEILLTTALTVPKGAVRIVSGHTSQKKTVEIDSLTLDEVIQKINT